MAFFLVSNDHASGALGLIDGRLYQTRADALAALRVAVSREGALREVDTYIVDLDAAVPALIVPDAQPTQFLADTPSSPGDIAPEETASQEPDVSESLAEVLARATASLESEGIVAPESVLSDAAEASQLAPEPEPVDETASVKDDSGQVSEIAQAWAVPEVVPEVLRSEIAEAQDAMPLAPDASDAPDFVESGVASIEEAPPGESWPWANVREFTPDPDDEVLTEEDEEPSLVDLESLDAPEEPPVEAESAPAMMDSDAVASQAEVPEPEPIEPEGEPVVEEVAHVQIAEPMGEPDAAPGMEVIEIPESEAAPPTGYETAGDLDLEQYTCSDCIYANTCPKVDQTTPAECGAFQWRPA
jgi:hypothetical protein